MRLLIAALTLFSACAAHAQDADAPAEAPERIFLNGVIHTGSEDTPRAEAVAVADGVVAFTGAQDAALEMAGAETEIVDLRGAVMFPGFTDAHAHLIGIGQRELTLNLEGSESLAGMLARLERWAEDHPEGVIAGRGWIETQWPEGRMPTREDLDGVVDDRPVLLGRADGHALVANSAALEAAGVTADSEDPDGGRIERDEDGAPNGILIDAAMAPVEALVQEMSDAERREALRIGAEAMAEYGWTGIHNMSVTEAQARDLDELAAAGELPIRVYNALDWGNDVLLEDGPWGSPDRRNVTRAYKVYADGALGSRGAALLEPYSDRPDTTGLLFLDEEKALAFYEKALREGIQIATHAIGDAANRQVLDLYSQAFVAVPPDERAVRNPRWRIEHSQIVDPADIERFASLGVIASMQPSHAIGDLYFAPDRLGEERLEGAYAWQSLIDAGAIVAAGSDAPVERGDARIEFYGAVARKGLDGFQGEGWHPEEAVDRQTALKMFTVWPAYASFREDELGVIAPGMRADFSVFRDDLLEQPEEDILRNKAVMTVVDGEIVYRADDEMWPNNPPADLPDLRGDTPE